MLIVRLALVIVGLLVVLHVMNPPAVGAQATTTPTPPGTRPPGQWIATSKSEDGKYLLYSFTDEHGVQCYTHVYQSSYANTFCWKGATP